MQKEGKLQKKILDYLNSKPYIWSTKIIIANKAGVPDIIGVCKGKFFAIEVKDKLGVVSALQKYVHTLIRKADGNLLIAYDLETVKQFIGDLDDTNSINADR